MTFQNLTRWRSTRPSIIQKLPTMTKEDLIAFEEDIAKEFNEGKIKAPVHLYSGNEEAMIDIFKLVNPQDWVFTTWRSHYQCLLKGVPKERVKQDIMDGKSITLCYPEYNLFSSAIVTGVIPIALGVAMNAYREKSDEHVWCFVGDMTSETGSFFECAKYANTWNLPITFVVEDNGKSVCTETKKVWNTPENTWAGGTQNIIYYKYETKYPHAGAGKRVQF